MADAQVVLCDTNILIDFSKRNPDIVRTLQIIGTANVVVSAISAGEFVFGALNKADLAKIMKGLNAIKIIHVDEAISDKGLELVQRYGLSHTLAVPDAFIAATALVHDLPLYTLNRKDFRFIEGLRLYDER
ncbi:MAG: type II toxin-antitoxin system VapC family toxin [Tunicatimonas sp.]